IEFFDFDDFERLADGARKVDPAENPGIRVAQVTAGTRCYTQRSSRGSPAWRGDQHRGQERGPSAGPRPAHSVATAAAIGRSGGPGDRSEEALEPRVVRRTGRRTPGAVFI